MKKNEDGYTVLLLSLLIGIVFGSVLKDIALGVLIGILFYPVLTVMKKY